MKTLAVVAVALSVLAACTRIDEYESGVYKGLLSGEVSSVQDVGLHHSILRTWTVYDLREIQYPEEADADVLTVLTSDQLPVQIESAYRYRIEKQAVRNLVLQVGGPRQVHELVYNAFRDATRDAVAEIAARDILSKERAQISTRIEQLMQDKLRDRGITVVQLFVRDIQPPPRLREAIEEKLAREQQVERERYQTQVVMEQANQRREEAIGIRDAQQIIAESLVGERGLRYLNWRYFETLKDVAEGSNNMVVVPITEYGTPLFFTPGMNHK